MLWSFEDGAVTEMLVPCTRLHGVAAPNTTMYDVASSTHILSEALTSIAPSSWM
jgi:hypothetical protein